MGTRTSPADILPPVASAESLLVQREGQCCVYAVTWGVKEERREEMGGGGRGRGREKEREIGR